MDFPNQLGGVGDYRWDLMSDYLNRVLDWLEDNADGMKVERWFFSITWKDIVNVGPDGYMGVVFFDGPDEGASLNCLGQVYRARALGLGRLECDREGNVLGTVVPPTPSPTPSAVLCRGLSATIVGTDGDDTLVGTPADDVIAGLGGNDVIRGGRGNDTICGGPGSDRIFGGPGDDELRGSRGSDIIRGGMGKDEVFGGRRRDRLYGGPGNDSVFGGSGNDSLFGGRRHDKLYGGPGDDRLKCGAGDDIAQGGPGHDNFDDDCEVQVEGP